MDVHTSTPNKKRRERTRTQSFLLLIIVGLFLALLALSQQNITVQTYNKKSTITFTRFLTSTYPVPFLHVITRDIYIERESWCVRQIWTLPQIDCRLNFALQILSCYGRGAAYRPCCSHHKSEKKLFAVHRSTFFPQKRSFLFFILSRTYLNEGYLIGGKDGKD